MGEKKVICDTDVIIDYWGEKNHRHVSTKMILENSVGVENIVISAITKWELLAGATNKTEMEKINKRLFPISVFLLNNDITNEAFKLQQKYYLSHNMTLADCLIASTSLVTGFELFTYNTKDYKYISRLDLYNIN
jgi:predicted nucleic acid-binding protein